MRGEITGLGHCLCTIESTPRRFLGPSDAVRKNSVSAEILEVVLFGPQRAKTPWFEAGRAWKMVRFLRRLPLKAP